MKTMYLLKEIYLEGFKNLGHFLVKNYFKVFTWFTVALLAIVMYAFLFRIANGFVFSNF